MNDYQFGNFVYRLREQKKMTQAELARMLGVTPAAVSKWENGSSKPRTEVLFRLAEILGVRPEELMAGHLIENPTLDPEVVKQINERYEYLRKVDACNQSGAKARRIFAWCLDWICLGFGALLLVAAVQSSNRPFLLLMAMLSFPVCFVLREPIFGGRSLGKRITKLEILDRVSGMPASTKQRVVRSLLFFLVQIDVIVLLATGVSLGDRLAHTVVVPLSVLKPETGDVSRINQYSVPKASQKLWIIIPCLIAAFAALVFGVTVFFLSKVKSTEEYHHALLYLIESETFLQNDLTEEDVRLTGFSQSTKTSDGYTIETLEYRFSVKGKTFPVVYHREEGEWRLCPDCTPFS